jgi:hypothetical protein
LLQSNSEEIERISFVQHPLVIFLLTKPGWRHGGLWIDFVFSSGLRRKFEAPSWVSKVHIPHKLVIELSSANYNAQYLTLNSDARSSQPCWHVIVVVPFLRSNKKPISTRIIDVASCVNPNRLPRCGMRSSGSKSVAVFQGL